MNATMVIPSYWARPSEDGWREGDAVFDHPTPLDGKSLLERAIRSVAVLKDRDFRLVVIAVATAPDIEARVEKRVAEVAERAASAGGVKEVLVFSHSHIGEMKKLALDAKGKEHAQLLSLRGYSDVRNMCTLVPHILGSDVVVLIDDDEVFEDPLFMSKAREFIGRKIDGKTADAVAGYYLQPDGEYRVKKRFRPWMEHWDKHQSMNEAFDSFIGRGPRLKETPFVFGGNMVVHHNLWSVVPFDPNVPRGEDIDFLINARMFGFTFLLDNQLSIKHLPPPKSHPAWMQLRQDIHRFTYERAKIANQRSMKGMTPVHAEDFDPYPGNFLKADLEDKVEKACRLLSEEYLAAGDTEGSRETLRNIDLAKIDAVPEFDPFERFCELQKRWSALMTWAGGEPACSALRRIVEGRR